MSVEMMALLSRCCSELGVELTPGQIQDFLIFAAELAKWNRKVNLTAITKERDIVIKHFADSLFLVPRLGGRKRLLDLGSGGGFPSIPLKIALPELEMVSVDSVLKKVLFQRHMERTLSFTEFAAVHARGEKLHLLYPGFFDCIVSRAFTELGKFAAMAAPLLVEGGIVIAMKGRGGSGEAADAEVECLRSGLTILEVFEYCLPVSGDQRSLILMGKANGGTGGIQEIE